MANSGIEWVDVTFNWCVWLLYEAAGLLGITYEEINIWLFVIIGPALFLMSVLLNFTYLHDCVRFRLTKHEAFQSKVTYLHGCSASAAPGFYAH